MEGVKMYVLKKIKEAISFATTGPGFDYGRIEERIRELAASFSKSELIIDTIPEGSYLQVKFDAGVPAGTYGDITLPSAANQYYILTEVLIKTSFNVQPQFYGTLINNVEKTFISPDPGDPGKTYYLSSLPVVSQARLYAKLSQVNTDDVSTAKAFYKGLVIRVSRVT
jgi:hypothetical protein